MSDPLFGANAKLGRAKQHVDIYERDLLAFFKSYSEAKMIHIDFEAPWYAVWSEPFPKPPVGVVLSAGDAINCLRSALDYLVCELVLKSGGEVTQYTQFPIYRAPGKFVEAVSLKNRRNPLAGLDRKGNAWALVERSQPYRSPNPISHPLHVIHALSNTDKHRLLLGQLSFPRFDRIDWLAWNPDAVLLEKKIPALQPVSHENRTDICSLRFDPSGPDPQVRMNGKVPLSPTIGNGDWQFAFTAIGNAHEYVSGILRSAAVLFL
ncbi:MAG: hypothetical protein QOE92_1525 [Chloroflexota bacterium]|nr:hypothetical protein [Chloroflexota bacterium]